MLIHQSSPFHTTTQLFASSQYHLQSCAICESTRLCSRQLVDKWCSHANHPLMFTCLKSNMTGWIELVLVTNISAMVGNMRLVSNFVHFIAGGWSI